MPNKKNLRMAASRRARARLPAVCVLCGATDNLTIDHKLSRALGGTNDPSNLQILCYPCNSAKGKDEGRQLGEARRAMLEQTRPAVAPAPDPYRDDGSRQALWAALLRPDDE